MIYAISLGSFVKKSFPSKTVQAMPESIKMNLPLDPKVSGMDIVLLQSRDVSGFKGESLLTALKTANEAVSIVYVYTNEKELNCLKDVKVLTKKIAKINVDSVSKVLEAVIESKEVQAVEDNYIPSKDATIEEVNKEPEETKNMVVNTVSEIPNLSVISEEETATCTDIATKAEAPIRKNATIEERISKLAEFGDFDLFKHALRKECVLKDIMQENTRFAGAVQMLDTLEREIANVFVSQEKTADEKMDLIKSIALRRVAYKEETNNILVDKFCNILVAILASTEATMNRRIKEAKLALDTVATTKILYKDSEKLNNLIAERLEMQVTLQELQTEIISLYQSADKAANLLIDSFEDGLPSENAYINEHLGELKPLFVPENAVSLANKLRQDLVSGRVKLSMFENQLNEVVKLIFSLCEHDSSIIDYQNKLITLLKSNRVEDVVIVNTILKSCMRLYIGPTEIGTRSTAITWAGITSRRSNSILLDLSGKPKFWQYGIEPVKLEDFLNERIQKQFLCVEGYVEDNEERILDIITELKLRLNYYPYINVILDPSQKTAIKLFSAEALTAHFITDSSPRSIAIVKRTIADFDTGNIAKKLVQIAPAVDPLKMCSSLGVDTMTTKVIIVPYLQRMKALAFNALPPHEDKEITEVFEEAFR